MSVNAAYLDGQDTDSMNMVELAVLLEDAMDIHDRHWKVHWMLNFAQFSATTALNATISEVKGEDDTGLHGVIAYAAAQRNLNVADSPQRLSLARDALSADPAIQRVDTLVIDGFDQFTALQLSIIALLANRSRRAVITLTGGATPRPAHRRFVRTFS